MLAGSEGGVEPFYGRATLKPERAWGRTTFQRPIHPGAADMKVLVAIPVYNEERHLLDVLHEVRRYSANILVVNDGSTDGTAGLLAQESDVQIITHPENRGYGAALISAFAFAVDSDADVLVTMDCDGQHEPARIPVLLEAIHDADI